MANGLSIFVEIALRCTRRGAIRGLFCRTAEMRRAWGKATPSQKSA